MNFSVTQAVGEEMIRFYIGRQQFLVLRLFVVYAINFLHAVTMGGSHGRSITCP